MDVPVPDPEDEDIDWDDLDWDDDILDEDWDSLWDEDEYEFEENE